MEFAKLHVTAYWGPLLILVRGCEGILLLISQVKLGLSQHSFITAVGLTITLNKIHGAGGSLL